MRVIITCPPALLNLSADSLSLPLPLPVPGLQFGALGLGCAGAAVLLYEGVRVSELALRPLPRIVSAPLAGAMCGAIALKYPQARAGYACICVCMCRCVCLEGHWPHTAVAAAVGALYQSMAPTFWGPKSAVAMVFITDNRTGESLGDCGLSMYTAHRGTAPPRCCTPVQVQYGYIALEEIFRDSTRMGVGSLLGLVVAKVGAGLRSLCGCLSAVGQGLMDACDG
jgi:hypothetical protein